MMNEHSDSYFGRRQAMARDKAVVRLSCGLYTCKGGDMDATPKISLKIDSMAYKAASMTFIARIC